MSDRTAGVAPSVVVITALYNGSSFVTQTLDSVQCQTTPVRSHIVVNDGSKDDSLAVVRTYAENASSVQVIDRPNAGASVARNTALLTLADDVDYVLFLDHDDILEPTAVEHLLVALQSNPDAVAAYGQITLISETGEEIGGLGSRRLPRLVAPNPRRWISRRSTARELGDDEPTTQGVFAYSQVITTPGPVLIRRGALDEVGGFAPGVGSSDYDYWLRLTALGTMVMIPEAVLRYRLLPGQMSTDKAAMRRDMVFVREQAIVAGLAQHPRDRSVLDQARHAEFHRAVSRLGFAVASARRGRLGPAARDVVRAMSSTTEVVCTSIPFAWVHRMRVAVEGRLRR